MGLIFTKEGDLSYHISCSSDKFSPRDGLVGIIFYSYKSSLSWTINGLRMKGGYIYLCNPAKRRFKSPSIITYHRQVFQEATGLSYGKMSDFEVAGFGIIQEHGRAVLKCRSSTCNIDFNNLQTQIVRNLRSMKVGGSIISEIFASKFSERDLSKQHAITLHNGLDKIKEYLGIYGNLDLEIGEIDDKCDQVDMSRPVFSFSGFQKVNDQTVKTEIYSIVMSIALFLKDGAIFSIKKGGNLVSTRLSSIYSKGLLFFKN